MKEKVIIFLGNREMRMIWQSPSENSGCFVENPNDPVPDDDKPIVMVFERNRRRKITIN